MLLGRKRQAPISLPGSYRADGKGKLTKRPDDDLSRSIEKMRIDGLRDRILADPGNKALQAEMKAHVRQRKAFMALEGDSLGLLTGEYRRRPKVLPSQPTPERINRGKELGEVLDKRQFLSEKGEPIGEPITEIVPQLRTLWRKGTINRDEFTAALQFCRDWHGSEFRGAATVRYEPRVDGGSPHYEAEHVTACRQRIRRAVRALGPKYSEALAWIVSSMGDGLPLYELGKRYQDDGEQEPTQSTQSIKGKVILKFTLADLCEHYGIDHKWVRRPRLTSHAQQIVAMLPEAA